MKQKMYIVAFLIILVLLVTGCFEYEEELVIRPNLSGTVNIHYRQKEGSNVESDKFTLPTENAEIRREVEEKYTSDKVVLDEFNVEQTGEWQDVDFTLKFNKVLDLNTIKQFADNKFEIDDKGRGRIKFLRSIEINSDWNEDEDTSILERLALTFIENALLDNVKFRFTVTMPRKIEKHNADWIRDEDIAVWRFTLTDLVKKSKIDMYLDCR